MKLQCFCNIFFIYYPVILSVNVSESKFSRAIGLNDKDYIFDLEDNSVILSSFIDWSANIAKIIDLKSVWPSFE